MYIQPDYNNVNMYGAKNKPGFWKRIKQKALDAIPSSTFKDGSKRIENWKKYDEILSRPAENRLIMGATALLTQPTIDYYNHKVDEETREISRNRTIAKIVAGTAVGILVRGSSYKLIKNMTNIKSAKKMGKILLPTKYLKDLISDPKLLKNYRSALSTSLAILAMCATNFLIDAPLTVFLTNHLNSKREDRLKKEAERRTLNE